MYYYSLSWIVFAMYFATAVLYWRGFMANNQKTYDVARLAFAITLAAHFAIIVKFTYTFGRVPIASVSETFSTLVFLTAATYAILEWRLKEYSMGVLLFPIFLILLFIGNITFDSSDEISEILKNVKFEAHVIAMLLGYGAFALSFIASLMHKLLARELQQRKMGVFYSRLPSLPFFEKISNAAIDTGLFFSTIGLGLGVYFGSQIWGSNLFAEPKLFSAGLTWIIYLFHAAARRLGDLRGQRATTISLIGFGWLLFSYLIISMMFTNIHQFS